MKLSVNILTWNNYRILRDTLRVLDAELKYIEHEVIIVDNGSTDGSQDLATIKNSVNLGISVGKNEGIMASDGEYILMIDGDIIPVPGSIICLLEWLEAHPDKDAIGFYPNKFSNQRNTETQKHHEEFCYRLYEPKIHTQAIIFYGMFRRSMFTEFGIKCDDSGPFAEVGYGWEDTDFFMQMKEAGVEQWVAGINHPAGKYYHAINSSIPQMGHEVYMKSSKERAEYFRKKWTKQLINT